MWSSISSRYRIGPKCCWAAPDVDVGDAPMTEV